jgi:hypothetical protein
MRSATDPDGNIDPEAGRLPKDDKDDKVSLEACETASGSNGMDKDLFYATILP